MAAALAPHLTVFAYDRRGRGDSSDTQSYAVEREIEDLDAVIPLPAAWASQVTIPTLVIDGGESPPQLRNAVAAVAELLPHAQGRTLAGHGHGAPPEVLAPVLEAFFLE